jgi:CheY-like chemotaxis protein
MKILYLDDDTISRVSVCQAVKDKFEIDAVEKAEEAFKLAKNNNYEVLLIDINLADSNIDGFGVIKKLKTFSHLKDSIYIAHTNYFGEKWRLKCINGGFHFYNPKPFILSEFEKFINK